MASRRRPQVEGLDNQIQRLRPQARATFSPAATPRFNPGTSGLERLRRALGQGQQALEAKIQQDHKDDATAAESAIAQMSAKEVREALEKQDLPEWKSPYFQKAFKRLAGARFADDTARQFRQQWEKNPSQFDSEEGFDKALADHIKEVEKSFGTDEDVLAGFGGVMLPKAAQLRQQNTQHLTETYTEEADKAVFDGLRIKADTMLESGADPKEIHQAVREEFSAIQENMGISYKLLDTNMVELAGYYADQGNVGLVKEIFESKRDGVGALGKTKKWSHKAEVLKTLAEKNHELNNQETYSQGLEDLDIRSEVAAESYDTFEEGVRGLREGFPEIMSEAKVQSLLNGFRTTQRRQLKVAKGQSKSAINKRLKEEAIRTNLPNMWDKGMEWGVNADGLTYVDADGQTQTIERDEVVKASTQLLTEHWAKVRDAQIAGGEDPEAAEENYFSTQVRLWGSRNDENPEWSGRMNAAAQWASTHQDPVKFNQEDVQRVTDAGELYSRLYRENPSLAQRQLTGRRTEDFMEGYRVGREYLKLSPDEAVRHAQDVMTRNSRMTDTERRDNLEELRDQVRGITSPSWYSRLFGSSSVDNKGAVQREIEQRAAMIMDGGGLSKEQAIKVASQEIQQQGFVVNGWWSMSRFNHPDNLNELFDAYRVSESGKALVGSKVESLEDMALRPVANRPDAFEVIDKSRYGLRPVAYVTTQELIQARQQVDTDESLKKAYEVLHKTSQGKGEEPQKSWLERLRGAFHNLE